jgi:hypothetical protein
VLEFLIIWGAAMIGVCAVLPYQMKMIQGSLEKARVTSTKKIPTKPVLILLSIVQSGLLLGIATGIGLWLAPKVNLHWWIIRHWLTGQPIPFSISNALILAVVSGILVALVIVRLDRWFRAKMPPVQEDSQIPGPIHGFFASFYGGIAEEVLLRLFLLTLFLFLFQWVGWQGLSSFWVANILTAILFGVGHLPAAKNLFGLNFIVVLRTIILNAIAGIAFGYLYWQYSLEIAMVSHFSADIVIHVLVPILKNRVK